MSAEPLWAIPATTLGAALQYAAMGWYVLPVQRIPGKGYKHAGSVLGKGWPHKTSRDPAVIAMWFAHPFGLALHVGRSGAVTFDVDHPEHLHPLLDAAIARDLPAFQSTSKVVPMRGHYVYALPDGVVLGNGVGSLKTDPKWGEVRGTNGIIVVEPTPRDDPAKQYRWMRLGMPYLPKDVCRALLGLDRPKVKPRFARNHIMRPGRGRIHALVHTVLTAENGKQQQLLFWAACRFGEMISTGAIDESVARELLIDAGMLLENFKADDPWTRDAVTVQVDSGLKTGRWATS